MAEPRSTKNGRQATGRTAVDRIVGWSNPGVRERAEQYTTRTTFEKPNTSLRLTENEMEAERRANERNGWGFTRPQVITQLNRYFNGDERTKARVYYRFEDANFHMLNRALESGRLVDLRMAVEGIYEDDKRPNARERAFWRSRGMNI